MTIDRSAHREALRLILSGDYRKGLEILERIDESIESLNDRAVTLHQLDRTRDAIVLLDKVVGMRPDYPSALLNRRYMGLALDAAPAPSTHRIIDDWGEPECPPPAVSVIIPTYDRPKFLDESVKSVLEQSFADFELIVVSDGGAAEAEGILRGKSDRIRYIKIEHGGISTALNAGVARARGKYIAYLDDDDIFYPDHLKTLVDYLESHHDVELAYSQSWRCTQILKDGLWVTTDRKYFDDGPFESGRLKKGNIIQTTGAIMHRRELVDKVGGFNEKIIGSQDWEWYLRVNRSYVINFVNAVTLEHRIKQKVGAQLSADRRVMRRNNMTVRYMNRLISLVSDVPGRAGYKKMMDRLAAWLGSQPDIIDVLDLNELANRKPYAFFFRLGKDLESVGDIETARKAYFEAFKLAPWEIKTYPKLLKRQTK